MKIAIIDKKDVILHIEQNTIKFEEQTIPFRLIDMLVLNHRATLNTADILKLTKENISILLVSHNNTNTTIINSANTKNADLKYAQYKSLDNKLNRAKYFVKNKLLLHKEQLLYNGISLDIRKQLDQIKNSSTIDELLGIEGSFARIYFGHYFSLLPKRYHKSKRTKQPPLDPVNAMMSFWYSLYYNIITIRLLANGLEPSMGYLHTAFRSHNALSSDILELFRAQINQVIINIFKNEILTFEDFTKKGGVYLKYDGRRKIWGEFVKLVNILKPKLNQEIANIKKELYV